MKEISYVMCTKDRGAIFRYSAEHLIQSKRPVDEIVIVNGGSGTETQAWLQEKLGNGLIDTLIAEKDRNQAHGWNRGYLQAQGQFIKKITDDDVFDYSTIRECATFLRANPEFDLTISNELFTDLKIFPNFNAHSFETAFHKWQQGQTKSFFFSDPHLLVRRTSLPLLGLFATGIKLIDYEWSLRVTNLGARIAYFTGCNSMTVWHQDTVTGLMSDQEYFDEYRRLDCFYRNTANPVSPWRRKLVKARSRLEALLTHRPRQTIPDGPTMLSAAHLEQMRPKLEEYNRSRQHEFLR
jgi:glycosyltransferase involved in cell wall biosynthesis